MLNISFPPTNHLFIYCKRSNLPTLAASDISNLSSHHTDEDFINKSLLDSLDAQADAEPILSSDSDRAVARSYGSTSDSSSGSPSVPFHIAMQSQQQSLTRPESPIDNNSQNMMHHLHSQDSMYGMHTPQNGIYPHPNGNNLMHLQQEYVTEMEAHKLQQQQGKVNGFNSYRTSFSAFPNTARPRHQPSSSILGSTNSYYPTSADIFSPQMTSPVQSYDSRVSLDINGRSTREHSYFEPYTPTSAVSQPHQAVGKPAAAQQPQHNIFPGQPTPYTNALHLSSQTPYGPHVPTNGSVSAAGGISPGPGSGGAPPGLGAPNGMTMPNNTLNAASSEEISTIFVVGFPEDMQVRCSSQTFFWGLS